MRTLIVILIILCFNQTSAGQQILGGDITWECIKSGSNQGKYVFQLTLFNQCSSGALSPTINPIEVVGSNISQIPLFFVSENDISAPCYDSSQQVTCVNSSTSAVTRGIYQSAPIQLMGTPGSGGWVFKWGHCCRPVSANLQGSNTGYTLRSIMYGNVNLGGPTCYDDSPKFIDHPTPVMCNGYATNVTNRAYDPDFDEVVHSWALALDSTSQWPAAGVLWKPGFSTTNQFFGTFFNSSNVPASLIPYNGEIRYTTISDTGRIFYTTKVASYRNNNLVSEVYRDVSILIVDCPPTPTIPPLSNTPPSVVVKDSAASAVNRPFPIVDTIIAGDLVSLHLNATDIQFLPGFSPQNNFLIARGAQMGTGNYDPQSGCPNPPCAILDTTSLSYNSFNNTWSGNFGLSTDFTWQTDTIHGSSEGQTYNFHFYVADDWCPNPGINEHTYTVVVKKPDNYITGKVYQDVNGNGQQDSGEPDRKNIIVKQSPDNYYVNTKSDGSYLLGAGQGLSVVGIIKPKYHVITQPGSNTYNITSQGQNNIYSGNDFGIQIIPGINDLSIDLSSTWITRPGWSKNYYVSYKNIGTSTLNATVKVILHPNLNLNSTTPTFSSNNGLEYTWNIGSLIPNQSGGIIVKTAVDSTASIGDTISVYASILPITGDTLPVDNVDSNINLVSASYDPNIKTVIPDRDIAIYEVKDGNYLEYTIHFQNTGSDTAFQVKVIDRLENSLDIESFEMLSASHDQYYQLRGRTLTWFFDDIKLPDSSVHFDQSIGYVKFRIRPDTSLQIGDSIFNEIGIYFDFNTPVIANVTTHIVEEIIDTNTSVTDVQSMLNDRVKLFPNPAIEEVTLEIKTVENDWMRIELLDVNGRVKSQGLFYTDGRLTQKTFNLSKYPAGLYVIRVSAKDMVVTKKLIVR